MAIGIITIGLVTVALLVLAILLLVSARLQKTQVHMGLAWISLRPVFYFLVIAGLLLMANRGPQEFIYEQF